MSEDEAIEAMYAELLRQARADDMGAPWISERDAGEDSVQIDGFVNLRALLQALAQSNS